MRPSMLGFGSKYYIQYDVVEYIAKIEYPDFIQIGSVLNNRVGVAKVITSKHETNKSWDKTWSDVSPRLLVNLDDKDILVMHEIVEDKQDKPSYIPDGWRLK